MGILEIFRPGMLQSSRYAPLKTFSSASTTAESVCVASVNQLKQLTTNFRFRHHSVSAYSLLWHTALIYLANSMLVSPKKKGWFFYFLLCVYGYKRLGRSWRVAKAISRALLSMALRKGDVSSATALQILKSLDQDEFSNAPGDIRATFMADLDLAQSDPAAATVESQAADFEWNKLMQDFIDNA